MGFALSSKIQDFFLLNLKSSKNQECIQTSSQFKARSDNCKSKKETDTFCQFLVPIIFSRIVASGNINNVKKKVVKM